MDPPVLRSCRLCATLPAATALARAFEASFLPLPPTHPPRAGSKAAGCGRLWGGGVLGAGLPPAWLPRARRLAPLLARSQQKREFCPFRRSFSASLHRRAHGRCAAAEPVQPVRPPAHGETRAKERRTRLRTLGNSPLKLGLQGT